MKNPDITVAKILKAKYFQTGSFMDAHFGINLSYTWHNLMAGREVLKERLAWRIGDGASVDTRCQNWLPIV